MTACSNSKEAIKKVSDKVGMFALANEHWYDTTSGRRLTVTVYFPDSATVKQLRDTLYWAKNMERVEPSVDNMGVIVDCKVKSENICHMIESLAECGGSFVDPE